LYSREEEKKEQEKQSEGKKVAPKVSVSRRVKVKRKVRLGMFDISPHQLGQVDDSMVHFLDLQLGPFEYAIYFGYGNAKSDIISSSVVLDPDDKSLSYNYFDDSLLEKYGPEEESDTFGHFREIFHASKLYFIYDFSEEAFFNGETAIGEEGKTAIGEEFKCALEVAHNRALSYYVALLEVNPSLIKIDEGEAAEDKVREELKANVFLDIIGSQAKSTERGLSPKDVVEKVYMRLRPAVTSSEDRIAGLYKFVPKGMRPRDFGYDKFGDLSLSTMAQSNLKSQDVKLEDIAQMNVKETRRMRREISKLGAKFDKIEDHLSWVSSYCQQELKDSEEDGETETSE
jgi:hypothetical protein